jgi:adenosylmethionine-8-amino-7-oxononanoate aminotransferase
MRFKVKRFHQVPFQKTLEKLYDIPIVGDIRGAGFFWGIEMVKNRETRESFNSDESEQLLRGFLSKALFDNGLCAPATAAPKEKPFLALI